MSRGLTRGIRVSLMFGSRQPPIPSRPRTTCAAVVYVRGIDVVIVPCRHTPADHGWNSEPVVKVGTQVPPAILGGLIRSALEASRWDAESPDSDGFDNPILQSFELKSWKRLIRETRSVTVELQGDRITVLPCRTEYDSKAETYIIMPERAITVLTNVSDEDVGLAVFAGLNRSIPWLNDLKMQPKIGIAYSPTMLPLVSSIEVVFLGEVDWDTSYSWKEPGSTIRTKRVEGEVAEQIIKLWKLLPHGESAMCHTPPFALRFFSGSEMICQGSICWHCNNIYGEYKGLPFGYAFDGEAEVSKKLLEELRCIAANRSAESK